ncbi:RNA polymerase sigma factor [Agromyces aerolatus]|uniref:RNA polymerase sigma factor n=1 Tax=Agromyces sp. LY-1074 TaxID=3074080 RepID=UPI0028643F97|nr:MULTISPECIES: DUF6596 domain-containing protein [unclassified Agromyces]MDR5698558.1 RNA polymerase subunit sigma-70 [Agromyces sp. LY-1074]MDR5704852.1 RNA polymerase subunit sigma-70 [Agromyces sp. LY-1358]
MTDSRATAYAAAERVAREAYGRLVAVLAAPTGDLALAEDAIAGAFETALSTWPVQGVPQNPEGWLVTVARNRQRDVWKSAAYRASVPLDERRDAPDASDGRRSRAGAAPGHPLAGSPAAGSFARDPFARDPSADLDPARIPDRRLELLAVCAHPAIDPAVRAPLMLQTVLGFEAAQIATAFAVPPATMAQRLVRAKRRIKFARIPFEIPDRAALAERTPALLEAVYGCAAISWRGDVGSLAGEAQYLAVVLATLLGDDREAWGLAAVATLSLARRRTAPNGVFVPLDEQDPADWDARLIDEGEAYLRRAAAGPGTAPGRFELEAAMQAVHADRRRTGRTDWAALRALSVALVAVAPSLGARVALAAVVGRTDGGDAGLELLPEASVGEPFQPWWATRADLLSRAGRVGEARDAFARAATMTDDPGVRAYLAARAESPRRRP